MNLETCLPKGFEGSIQDALELKNVEPRNLIEYATTRMSKQKKWQFGVWCARGALGKINRPDTKAIFLCDVAEKYAVGSAKNNEILAAISEARDALRYYGLLSQSITRAVVAGIESLPMTEVECTRAFLACRSALYAGFCDPNAAAYFASQVWSSSFEARKAQIAQLKQIISA